MCSRDKCYSRDQSKNVIGVSLKPKKLQKGRRIGSQRSKKSTKWKKINKNCKNMVKQMKSERSTRFIYNIQTIKLVYSRDLCLAFVKVFALCVRACVCVYMCTVFALFHRRLCVGFAFSATFFRLSMATCIWLQCT